MVASFSLWGLVSIDSAGRELKTRNTYALGALGLFRRLFAFALGSVSAWEAYILDTDALTIVDERSGEAGCV